MIRLNQASLIKIQAVFSLLWIGYGFDIHAQELLKLKTHSLTYGISRSRLTDGYKDYRWVGTNLHEVSYQHSIITPQRIFQTGISFSKGSNAQFSQVGIDWNMLSAYSVLKNNKKTFNTYLGVVLEAKPVYTKSASSGKPAYSWINTNTAGLFQRSVLQKGKHSWELEFRIPLLGWSSRPAAGSANRTSMNEALFDSYQTGFFTSLHRLQSADLSLRYNWRVSSRLATVFGYRYAYRQMKMELNYREQVQGLRVGIKYSIQ